MSTTQGAFLGLLASGLLALLTGLLLTRLRWRTDIPPYGAHTRLLDVALHPERCVSAAPVRAIRCLNVTGALLLAGAVAVVGYEILRTTLSR
jgi:hypothetical protein